MALCYSNEMNSEVEKRELIGVKFKKYVNSLPHKVNTDKFEASLQLNGL